MKPRHPNESIARRENGECTSVTPQSVTALARTVTALNRLEAHRNPRRWNPWLDELIDSRARQLRTALGKNTEERLW
jgi:hypothetical protein